jgi:hypothetical protein
VIFLLVVKFMGEFEDLVSWLDKESRKPFVVKKVSFSKAKLSS